MNLSILSSLLLVALAKESFAGPSAPQISVGLNTATAGSSKLGGIEPSVKWQTTGSFEECDVAAGIDVQIKDVDSYKESIWGMVTRSVGDFGLTLKAKGSPMSDPSNTELSIQCDAPTDTVLSLEAAATAGGKSGFGFGVSKVKAVQSVDALGGSLILAPSYDLAKSKGDLSVAFAKDSDSNVQVDVDSEGGAKLSLMQRVGDNHVLRPSITKSGDFELNYDTQTDFGKVTTTYKPNSYVNVKWSDGPWQANFNAPMDGYYNMKEGVKISVKTRMDVNTGSLIK